MMSSHRRRRVALMAAVAVAGWCAAAGAAHAQTLNFSLSRASISFASADPDTTPLIASQTVTVTYRVRNNDGGGWRITILASGDLSGAGGTIPVSTLTWTATPSPFQGGTVDASIAQLLAQGTGNVNPAANGQVTFYFANSWDHNVGTYTTVLTLTLTAP